MTINAEALDLHHCPFCGGVPKLISDGELPTRYRVECTTCGAKHPFTFSRRESTQAWQHRYRRSAPIAIQGDESREPVAWACEYALGHFTVTATGEKERVWVRQLRWAKPPTEGEVGCAFYRNVTALSSQARLDGAGTPEGGTFRDGVEAAALLFEDEYLPAMLDVLMHQPHGAERAAEALAKHIRALSPPSQEAANGPAKSERIERGAR